jgi:hypothetical protein
LPQWFAAVGKFLAGSHSFLWKHAVCSKEARVFERHRRTRDVKMRAIGEENPQRDESQRGSIY